MKDKSSNAVFDWNVTGASLCYLGFEVNFLIPPSSAIMFLTLKLHPGQFLVVVRCAH
jgi:ATP-binding cassette subfamily A (ABC1) protein 3